MTRFTVAALTATAALALAAGPVLSQSAAPSVDAQLRARGEEYHRAPDTEQNPAEVTATQRLNTAVAVRNDIADQTEQADAEAVLDANVAARAEYSEDVAETRAENARRRAETRAAGAFNAEQQARYEKAMVDWRATVRACEAGDTARCRAGQQQPILSDY